MDALTKVKQYLEHNSAPYQVVLHEEVYTAQELAQVLHTPGRELVKVVIVKADDTYWMAVLPASRKIDLQKLTALLKAKTLTFAKEQEMKALFPEAEIGAMPPFGNLYNMNVCIDSVLTNDEHITFNAGTHYAAIRMKYRDFKRLLRPCVGDFTVPT
jgi:Ala-tRNA(Pro) deacylase